MSVLLSAALAVGLLPGLLEAQSVRGTYTVTEDVPLRAGPGTNHPIITTLPKGIKIQVVGREGYWLRVESKHGARPGYIDDRFARLDSPEAGAPPRSAAASAPVAGAYRTLRQVELREGPGTRYKSVATIPSGIKVHVLRAEGDWLRVESKSGGKPGYLEKRDVERWTDR
jgi:mannosyl-glycoprotein endo-beta-N-acetylglucosaminidase